MTSGSLHRFVPNPSQHAHIMQDAHVKASDWISRLEAVSETLKIVPFIHSNGSMQKILMVFPWYPITKNVIKYVFIYEKYARKNTQNLFQNSKKKKCITQNVPKYQRTKTCKKAYSKFVSTLKTNNSAFMQNIPKIWKKYLWKRLTTRVLNRTIAGNLQQLYKRIYFEMSTSAALLCASKMKIMEYEWAAGRTY